MVTIKKKLERIRKIEVIGIGEPCPKCLNPMSPSLHRVQTFRARFKHLGIGEPCPKCLNPMQTRRHRGMPNKSYFYSQWDYCVDCKHVQHYEKYKCSEWKEREEQLNFFKSI